MMKYFLLYLLIVNAVSFLLMRLDKQKARKHQWRIRESTLLLWAWLGGSIGTLAAMGLVRHKTRHPKFTAGVPLILILQILLFSFIIFYFNA